MLNLAFNKLLNIPDVPNWSSRLGVLDLSHNQLTSMPVKALVPAIQALNLSYNKFRRVPPCICSFTTLHFLDISENPDILTLPADMGKLKSLSELNLKGLNYLTDPPRSVLRNTRDCIHYLYSKLYDAKEFYHMKLMLVGLANRGKTTLVARLKGKDCGDKSGHGIDISKWAYRPSLRRKQFHFSIWDLGGQEEYYATHQYFLTQCSLYLLLFNLKHGDAGVQELKPWLNNIALRAPHSRIIIVGTHLDEVQDGDRVYIDKILQKVADLAVTYRHKIEVMEVIPVGLKNRLKNVGVLKQAIYNHAEKYKTPEGQLIMGQKIPASYHALHKQLDSMQRQVRSGIREPIMYAEEFKTMVQQFANIQEDDEIKTVTLFLTDMGSLLHYDDLHELYFIDPCWLCDMLAKVVTIEHRNLYVKRGILHSQHLPLLLDFPWKFYEQYVMLLDRFEIAVRLDDTCTLIPSKLPNNRPSVVDEDPYWQGEPLYSRYIIFASGDTPPGFWSRLLSRVMRSVLQVITALTSQCLEDSLMSPDRSLIKMEYWRHGLFYSTSDVLFRIEKLLDYKKSMSHESKDRDGVVIVTSPNRCGKMIMGELVDLVVSLVGEWYPGLQAGADPTLGLEQRVPCCKCLKIGRQRPYEFKVEHCLTGINFKETTMECQFEVHDKAKNHTVPLTDIVPDLLEFLLKPNGLIYTEGDISPLGNGSYGKVYRGKYNGKPVAIKKYLLWNEDALSKLCSEAKLLQKSHHPCLVSLVGVSIHPIMALVMEDTPMGSLEKSLIINQKPVHRLTIYRMGAEVAAALRFLHRKGIIFCHLEAANVLLWTLDYHSLFHCKLSNFEIATHRFLAGTKGMIGTKGFIAPEVLYNGKRKQYSMYNPYADIFSFGMFLYQLIARRHPYHDTAPQLINTAVEQGERPQFQDIPQAKTAYHYLTRLMKMCWENNPRKRPSTDDIIRKLCNKAMQSVMSVHPVCSRFSLRRICAITPADFTKAGITRSLSELWVCCDGIEGAEVNIYMTDTIVNICKHFIKGNQIQCIALCGDHMWVASKVGIDYGMINIFSIGTRKHVHNFQTREMSVSCITCSEMTVFLGTLEGHCFSFCRDIIQIQASAKPRKKYISEYAVNGIVFTHQYVWVSHTRYIDILNPDNLDLVETIHRQQGTSIGQLSLSKDGNTIWSAHVGGVLISAWDASRRMHKYDINVDQIISNVCEDYKLNFVITAMCPVLDTIWVGLASGHVMVFENEDLLTYYHLCNEHIGILVCIHCSGPCKMEQAMVVSGTQDFKSLVPDMPEDIQYDKVDESGEPVGQVGVLVLWEAYDAKTTRQVKSVDENAPDLFDSHHTVNLMIHQGEFKDGTHIMGKTREATFSDLSITSSSSMGTQLFSNFSTPSIETEPFGSWPQFHGNQSWAYGSS